MNLDELKSRRKEFVSLALTADCGDDYWNDVDEIDKQINRRYKMNENIKKVSKLSGGCFLVILGLMSWLLLPLGGYLGWVWTVSEKLELKFLFCGIGITAGFFLSCIIRAIVSVIWGFIVGED